MFHSGIEADRKKGKTEQSLDDMLFGKAPVRRRAPSENKPAETAKPAEPAKVVEQKGQTSGNNTVSVSPGRTVVPQGNAKVPEPAQKNEPNKPNIKPT